MEKWKPSLVIFPCFHYFIIFIFSFFTFRFFIFLPPPWGFAKRQRGKMFARQRRALLPGNPANQQPNKRLNLQFQRRGSLWVGRTGRTRGRRACRPPPAGSTCVVSRGRSGARCQECWWLRSGRTDPTRALAIFLYFSSRLRLCWRGGVGPPFLPLTTTTPGCAGS